MNLNMNGECCNWKRKSFEYKRTHNREQTNRNAIEKGSFSFIQFTRHIVIIFLFISSASFSASSISMHFTFYFDRQKRVSDIFSSLIGRHSFCASLEIKAIIFNSFRWSTHFKQYCNECSYYKAIAYLM